MPLAQLLRTLTDPSGSVSGRTRTNWVNGFDEKRPSYSAILEALADGPLLVLASGMRGKVYFGSPSFSSVVPECAFPSHARS